MRSQPISASPGHDAPLSCTASDASGRRIATGSYDATIRIWDPDSAEQLRSIRATSLVNGIVFSPDGLQIASGECDYIAYIREISTGREIRAFRGHEDDVNSVAWSPDGNFLATASFDDTARIWDVSNGECLLRLTNHTDDVNGVHWSPDGKRISTASDDRTVRIWDAHSGEERLVLDDASDWCDHAPFSPDGSRIACSSMEGRARVYDAESGQLLLTLSHHDAAVKAVCWSRDGRRICTASYDHHLREFDAETGRILRKTYYPNMWSRFIDEIGDTGRYLTGSFAGAPVVWDAKRGTRELIEKPTQGLNAAALSSDARWVALSSDNGSTEIVERSNNRRVASLRAHEGAPLVAEFCPSGELLAIGAWDGSVAIHSCDSWELTSHIRGLRDIVCALTFSEDGSELVCATYSGAVLRWNVATGQLLGVLTLHHGSAKALCRGADGTYLSGGRDGTIHRSHADGSVEIFRVANTIINAVALSPDQRVFASASRDHSVRIHDSANGEVLARFEDHPCSIKTVTWSNDGHSIAAGYYDGTIVLWDPESSQSRLLQPKPAHAISQISFLPDGNLLVGSWNPLGRARILDQEGEPIASLGGKPLLSPRRRRAPQPAKASLRS